MSGNAFLQWGESILTPEHLSGPLENNMFQILFEGIQTQTQESPPYLRPCQQLLSGHGEEELVESVPLKQTATNTHSQLPHLHYSNTILTQITQ